MEQENARKDILDQADRRNKFITAVASIALSAMGVIFVVFTLYAGLNLGSEIDRIANFRKEIKGDIADFRKELKNEINEFLGKSDRKPILELFARIDIPLEGNTLLLVTKVKDKEKLHAYFPVILKNKGEVTAKIEAIKFYFKKPLTLKSKSTDEKEYSSEDYMDPEDLFSVLPAGASRGITYWMDFDKREEILNTVHQVLVKVYFCEKQPVACKFNIKFPEKF